MVVTDKIRHVRKDLGHSFDNPCPHVVNRGHRIAKGLLDLLEEWDDRVSFLGGQFDVAQNDLRDGVETTHEQRFIPITCGIEMKDVPSVRAHRLLDAGSRLSMCNGEVDDKLLSQVIHLTGTDADVLSRQFVTDLLAPAVTQKQCSAHVDQDVIAKVAAWRHQATKVVRTIGTSTTITDRDRFLGVEHADVQRDYVTLLGFEYLESLLAIRTVVLIGTKGDHGGRGNKKGRDSLSNNWLR